MVRGMATHEIRIDRSLPLAGEPHTGHNRWHPDIPPILRCNPGDEVVLETRDTFDGAFDRRSVSKSVEEVDFGLVHPLTGENLHPGYPARFVRFETGTHGTPIRMTDWRETLNWMLSVSR